MSLLESEMKIRGEETDTILHSRSTDLNAMPLDKLNGIRLPASADFHGG